MAVSASWSADIIESGGRVRECASFWTLGIVKEKREEILSKLWSDSERGEFERLDMGNIRL